jgi:hypothetical protein
LADQAGQTPLDSGLFIFWDEQLVKELCVPPLFLPCRKHFDIGSHLDVVDGNFLPLRKLWLKIDQLGLKHTDASSN